MPVRKLQKQSNKSIEEVLFDKVLNGENQNETDCENRS